MGYLGGDTVPWTRPLFPYPGSVPILGDGFLEDPERRYPSIAAKAATPLAELSEPVVVIVGESGIGKTQALRAEALRLQDAGRSAVFVDLSGLDAHEAGDEIAHSLRRAGSDGDVFADGLDQTVGTLQSVARAIRNALERHEGPLPRLRFSTVTGSAWPATIKRAMSGIDLSCLVYQFGPLTAAQARQAAATEMPDADGFMRDVETLGIGPLAAHPLSLRLLLQASRRGPTPRTRAEAYGDGIAALADGSPGRTGGDRPPIARVLGAARRLAAATALSGTKTVCRRRLADQTGRAIALDDIDGGDVSLTDLYAVFDSSLMQGSPEHRTWFHRSIEEFLCAQRLRSLPKDSVQALLASPAMPHVIAPQLVGVAAWLASTDDGWFDWALQRRYELLFNPDLQHRPEDQRRRLAATLVEHLMNDEVPYNPAEDPETSTWQFSLDYSGLRYPELGDDLAPLLAAGQPAWRIREALLVVIGAGLRDLDAKLMTLIETVAHQAGPDEYNIEVQAAVWAAIALRGNDDAAIVGRGTALLRNAGTHWTLRAELARWLWPTHLTAAELDAAIPPGDRTAGGGAFARTLAAIVLRAGTIAADQDAGLLQFLATLPSSTRRHLHRIEQTSRLVRGALRGDLSDNTSWRHAVTITAAMVDEHSFPEGPAADAEQLHDERRRRFVADVAAQIRPSSIRVLVASGLTGPHDAVWWAQRMAAAQERASVEDARRAEAALATIAITITDPAQLPRSVRTSAAQLASGSSAAAMFDHWFSAEAFRRRAEQPLPTAMAEPSSTDQLLERLNELLTHDDDRALDAIGEEGPAHLPWHRLTVDQQRQLTDRARQQLLSPKAEATTTAGWQRLNAAHAVLTKYDAHALSVVPIERWLAWLPLLLGKPDTVGPTRTAIHQSLKGDPAAAEQILIPALGEPTVVWQLRDVQTSAISQAALDLAEKHPPALDGHHLHQLLTIGAGHHPDRAARIATALIRRHRSNPNAQPEIAVHAAAALAGMPTLSDHYDELMTELRSDNTFATNVIRTAARSGGERTWTALTPEQISDLFSWADTALPEPPFPPPGVYVSTDPAPGFTDHLLEILSNPKHLIDGAAQPLAQARSAVSTLERLADSTGDVFIRQRARRLEDTAIAAGPTGSVAEILAVLDLPELRSVSATEQCAEVLLTAMDDFAGDVRKDRALCSQAWHRQRNGSRWDGTWVPKDENEISTWLTRELKHYLRSRVALYREVEINSRLGATAADRPDIVAVALHTAAARIALDIIIEVKGNWHAKVMTALSTQLADRYLAGPLGSTGIYLIAYFAGNTWNGGDSRKDEARRLTGTRTPRELQQFLQQKVDAAVAPGRKVHVRVIDFSL
ncbi:ATP-binding protein [Micromonospora tulbaghiae]|uniref:ATP-binding protein n=1 Tax=Micromonospora tulbaghiae TaxID=479978 RepID=UPI0029C24EE6|nr:ATP-binding protein [Micromonospora tulbaghiae]MDX5461751.1 ATP-binding protein [Micromonospora tulbaghiae]